MASPARPDITLTSTTDPIEAVQAALGQAPTKTEAPPTEVKAEPATDPAKEPVETKADEPAAGTETQAGDEPAAAEPTDEEKAAAEALARSETAKKGGLEKSRLDKRIKQLVDARDKEKGLNAALSSELEALRKRVGELTVQAAQPAPATDPAKPNAETKPAAPAEPQPGDFETYDLYVKAAAKHAAEQAAAEVKEATKAAVDAALKAEQEKAAKASAETKAQQIEDQYQATLESARLRHDDFDEVVNDPTIKLTRTLFGSIKESEIAGEMIYHLVQHREELDKLYAMGDSIAAVKAFGRLEDKIKADLDAAESDTKDEAAKEAPKTEAAPAAKPEQKKVATKAPDPIKATKGSSVAITKDPDKMDYQEYKVWRNAQIKERPKHGML